jgi:hypothetical protein
VVTVVPGLCAPATGTAYRFAGDRECSDEWSERMVTGHWTPGVDAPGQPVRPRSAACATGSMHAMPAPHGWPVEIDTNGYAACPNGGFVNNG